MMGTKLEMQPVITDVTDWVRQTSQTAGYIPKLTTLPISEVACYGILVCSSLLLYEPYANVSSQICPFLALLPQFDSNHRVNLSTPR